MINAVMLWASGTKCDPGSSLLVGTSLSPVFLQSICYCHELGAFCQLLRLEVQYQHPVLFLGVCLCAAERGILVSFPATRVLVLSGQDPTHLPSKFSYPGYYHFII